LKSWFSLKTFNFHSQRYQLISMNMFVVGFVYRSAGEFSYYSGSNGFGVLSILEHVSHECSLYEFSRPSNCVFTLRKK